MMFQYAASLEQGFDAAFVKFVSLRWVKRDSAKPGRGDIESWSLHALAVERGAERA